MKRAARFSPDDAARLRRTLRTIAEPARRHFDPFCKEIFECHLCTMEEEHPLHWDNCKTPFMCQSCAEFMNIKTMASIGNKGPRQIVIYDYQTGERLDAYPCVRGIQTQGRIRAQGKERKWIRG